MSPAPSRERLEAVDALRGLVMVLMALDHARDYFGDIRLAPEAVASTTPLLFATRWVTHLCAPVFVFLAGSSACLWAARGRSQAELSRWLATRGAWLVLLEFTVVGFGWTLSLGLKLFFFQVIAAIGFGMIALAGLARLPRGAVLALGLLCVAGHDALAGISAQDLGPLALAWTLLLEPRFVVLSGGVQLNLLYPILPWTGVMLLGWAFGPLLLAPREERRATSSRLGLAATLAFVLLRASNLYGDPQPWAPQPETWRTVVSFLNATKYPPSLCFVLMTLGPALALLAALDGPRGVTLARPLLVFGRVPLFFYVVHLYLLSLGSALTYLVEQGRFVRLFPALLSGFPPEYGHGLGTVYAAWIGVVLALYLPCRWYGALKRRSRSALLAYL